MRDVTLTWDLPTTRKDGGALTLEELGLVELELSADGGVTYTNVASLPASDPQTAFLPQLAFATWPIRLRVTDTDGRPSDWAMANIVVVDDSPPAMIVNIQYSQA